LIINQLDDSKEYEYGNKTIDVPYKVNRKAKVLYRLIDYLEKEKVINVEGFLNFRLNEYFTEVYEILDKLIDEYMMEKEYEEFIGLLKYFVNTQKSQIDTLNIVVDKKGKYHFYDKSLKALTEEYIKDTVSEISIKNLSSDDLLLSYLITLLPEKINFHQISNIRNKEIIETIKNIFENRVYICNNCRICNLGKSIREE